MHPTSTIVPLPSYLPLDPFSSRDVLAPTPKSTFSPLPTPILTPNLPRYPTISPFPTPLFSTPIPTTPLTSHTTNTPLSYFSHPNFSHSSPTVPRHTTRSHKPPSYLQQYICNIAISTSSIPSFIEPQYYKTTVQDPIWTKP